MESLARRGVAGVTTQASRFRPCDTPRPACHGAPSLRRHRCAQSICYALRAHRGPDVLLQVEDSAADVPCACSGRGRAHAQAAGVCALPNPPRFTPARQYVRVSCIRGKVCLALLASPFLAWVPSFCPGAVQTCRLRLMAMRGVREQLVLLQEQQKQQEREAFAAALQEAIAEERPPADARERWLDSEFAPGIGHLETFAYANTEAPHSQALYAMLDTGVQVTPDGAAHLLKRLGIWPSRMPNTLARFPPSCP